MKKIISLLAVLALIVPFVGADARGEDCATDSKCKTYKMGDIVNFYTTEGNQDDMHQNVTIVLEDNDLSSKQTVKVMAFNTTETSDVYFDPNLDEKPMDSLKTKMLNYISGWSSAKPSKENITLITKDEVLKLMGYNSPEDADSVLTASKPGGTTNRIPLDVNKFYEVFKKENIELLTNDVLLTKGKNGFYTSTYDLNSNKVWVVAFTLKANSTDIETVALEEVDMKTNNYVAMPVVSFDKTYDCLYQDIIKVEEEDEYACYSCNEEYSWKKIGTQDAVCTVVEDINVKEKCVKTPPTGVKEYAFELIVILVIGIGAIFAISSKNRFRNI